MVYVYAHLSDIYVVIVSFSPPYILKYKKEIYGYNCLTNQKQYYLENEPNIAVENGTIDDVITMMSGGAEI